MVIHSDSTLGAIFTFVVMLFALGLLVASTAFLVNAEFRRALKTFTVGVGLISAFVLATIALSELAPETVVKIGDSYCEDIWCIGIDQVHSSPRGQDILYTLDVQIFSEANHVKKSAKGVPLYLFDERGRQFPLIDNPSVVKYDAIVDPGQTIRTTLVFAAPADSKHLYLWGAIPPGPVWVRWYFGSVRNVFRSPVLIRVI